jgi:hypothetical protein
MPLSVGYSYDSIQTALGMGGAFEGFRLATRDEVISLWTSAGIPDINTGASAANIGPVQSLINTFIGQTSVQSGNPQSFGFTADLTNTGLVYRATLDFVLSGGNDTYSASTGSSQGVGASFSTFGAWLVKDTAPTVAEPGTAALLVLGIAVIGTRRRRDP